MGKWTTIAEAAIELLSKKSGGALPADEAASVVPKLLRDNPGAKDPEFYGPGGWLGSKIRKAAEKRASATPYTTNATLGGMEGVTGFFRENLRIRPDALRGIKGAMGEERFAGGAKLKNLEDSIAKEGYRDDSPVLIAVREDGTPFIVEGNNRVEEAIKTGRPHIKVQLQYLRGAEDVEGPLSPDNLPSVMALPTDEASRMARAQEMGFDTDAPLYRGTTEQGATTAQKSFEAGDGIFLSDNPDVAEIFRYPREYGEVITENYDDALGEFVGVEPGDLQTLYARMQNPMRLSGENANKFTEDTAYQIDVIKAARAAGNDSIVVENVMEGVGDWTEPGTTVVALRPVRAKAAQFDPAKAGSADILAGLGVVGAGAALSQQDGFDYGALSNVAEESNGQSSN